MRTRGLLWAVACAAAIAAGNAGAQNKNDESTMTYTGCIEPGKEAGSYMLTHVMAAEAAAAGAESKQGSAPATLDIAASGSVKLAPHSGHKVTVTGKTMQHDNQTMLMVDSLKMVSRSCP